MDQPPHQNEEMEESFIRVLTMDFLASLRRYEIDNSQSVRRDLVRTAFAGIEGLSWIYRQHVVGVAETAGLLTAEEKGAFADFTYYITDKGMVARQPRFMSLPATILSVTRIASRLDSNLHVDFGTKGWENLRHAIKLRNRIMHPKQVTDLHIDDAELARCSEAFVWLLNFSVRAMSAANTALSIHVTQLRAIFERLEAGDAAALAEYQAAFDRLNSAEP